LTGFDEGLRMTVFSKGGFQEEKQDDWIQLFSIPSSQRSRVGKSSALCSYVRKSFI